MLVRKATMSSSGGDAKLFARVRSNAKKSGHRTSTLDGDQSFAIVHSLSAPLWPPQVQGFLEARLNRRTGWHSYPLGRSVALLSLLYTLPFLTLLIYFPI